MLFNIKTEDIYEFHISFILKITDQYHSILKIVADFYEPNNHNINNFATFTQKVKKLISNFKVLLRRSSEVPQTIEYLPNLRRDDTKQLLSNTESLMKLIHKFRQYQALIKKCEEQFGGENR